MLAFKTALCGGLGWITAQATKIIILLIKAKKNHTSAKDVFVQILKSGGMPSTHSSVVFSLATTIIWNNAFSGNDAGAAVSALSLIFAVVVAFDAFNVRKQCGDLAVRFNEMAKECGNGKFEELKPIEGHTLPEVIVGGLCGIATGCVLHFLLF